MARLDKATRDKCIELIRDGKTPPQIKAIVNVSNSTIRFLAFKSGLTLQTNWGPSRSSYWERKVRTTAPMSPQNVSEWTKIKANLRW